MLKRRVVNADHADLVVTDQCRIDVGILSSERHKLVSTACELHALIIDVVARLFELDSMRQVELCSPQVVGWG